MSSWQKYWHRTPRFRSETSILLTWEGWALAVLQPRQTLDKSVFWGKKRNLGKEFVIQAFPFVSRNFNVSKTDNIQIYNKERLRHSNVVPHYFFRVLHCHREKSLNFVSFWNCVIRNANSCLKKRLSRMPWRNSTGQETRNFFLLCSLQNVMNCEDFVQRVEK